MIFIGDIIKQKLQEQEKSIVWLAKEMNCSRTNIYKIFRRQSIDAGELLHISRILKYNFFELYCREAKRLIEKERQASK